MIDLINSISEQWYAILTTSVIQNTMFLGFLFAALYILRNSAARIKYLIALIGLIKLLFIPVFPVPIFPSSLSAPVYNFTRIVPLSTSPLAAGQASPTDLNFTSFLFLSWLLMTVGYLIFSIIVTCKLHLSLKNAQYVCTSKDNIPIHINNFPIPFSTGLWKKRIYLPSKLYSSNKDNLEYILKHETAHIKRKDHVVQIVQTLIQALYFFHPLVWFLNKRMDEYREMACDDQTVGKEYDSRIAYSKILIEIAEGISQNGSEIFPATAILKHRNELVKRIKYQIREKIMNKNQKWTIGLTVSVLILMAVVLSWNCSQEDAQTKQTLAPDQNTEIVDQKTISDDVDVKFIPHDEAPEPIGGYEAIQENLHYPEIAIKAGIEGKVLIWAFVDKSGKVTKTKVKESISSGDSGCEEAAIKAISSVTWKPAKKDRDPIGVWVMIPVEFTLNDNKDNPTFVPYDEPPKPVGGFDAIQEYLHYPEIALKAGIEGKVFIWAFVNKSGKVAKTKVKKGVGNGDSGCEEAAIKAISSVKWEPATANNDPIGAWVLVPIEFNLK